MTGTATSGRCTGSRSVSVLAGGADIRVVSGA